jgi:hypothetical protein
VSSFEAASADVTWRVHTGDVRSDMARIRREFLVFARERAVASDDRLSRRAGARHEACPRRTRFA